MATKKIKAMGNAVKKGVTRTRNAYVNSPKYDAEAAAKIHGHVIQPTEEAAKKVGAAAKKAAYPVTAQKHSLREAHARYVGGRGIAQGAGVRSESKAAKQPIAVKKAAAPAVKKAIAPKKAAAAPKKTKTTAITRKRTTK